MNFKKLNSIIPLFASAAVVPLLTIIAPGLISLSGLGPSWVVLWLLPWALNRGQLDGVLAALGFGLILDAISLENISYIPTLVCLGFWWGRLGAKGFKPSSVFHIGFLACIGTALLEGSLWLQQVLLLNIQDSQIFNNWASYTLLVQVLITGLFAPIVCNCLLPLLTRRNIF